jgi:diaminobutyrate-2-oxoglutarate transaminase
MMNTQLLPQANERTRELYKPRVSTLVPGPRSERLLQRQASRESNARSYPIRLPIAIDRAQGSYVQDVDGNVFIDFLTGAGALPLGHNHPEICEAVRQQLERHCHGLDFPTPAKDAFTACQLALLPKGMKNHARIHFCGPTGSDAVDAALKLCKIYTKRTGIVTFQGGFHGTTQSSMAVTGMVAQKESVGSTIPDTHFFPYPYLFRCPIAAPPERCASTCLTYLENALTDPNGGIAKPAAVIMEIIQGEGGVIPAPVEFVQGVRRLTERLGILLVIDEVQTGCGRTGTWYAFEQCGIVPDVIVVSKGLGGIGMPVAIIIYREELDVWTRGAHTGTFRGNQLAFVAGVAAVKIVQRDNLLTNVVGQGTYLMRRLRMAARSIPFIGDVRGRGLMIGLELIDPATGAPDGQLAARLQRAALLRGLVCEVGGRDDAVIRLLPPLNVSRATVDQSLDILDSVFASVVADEESDHASGLVESSDK